MEAYSTSYSSSNSSYLTQTGEESKGLKHAYPLQSHTSWLHSVRKSPAKSWNKKAPVAPMPPTPVKVYKVDAINFRDVVQKLTGAPDHKPQQILQTNIARADTSLGVAPKQSGDTKWYDNFQFGMNYQGTNDGAMTQGFLGMNFPSPSSSYSNFCFFPPMSPRAVTSFEPGKVL
ncbi:VQ motif-containing protein 29, partial [Mucuna pruriens]